MCLKENGTDDDEEEEEVNGEVVSEWPDCTVFTDFLTDKKFLRIYEKKTNTTTNPYNFPKIRTFFCRDQMKKSRHNLKSVHFFWYGLNLKNRAQIFKLLIWRYSHTNHVSCL